MAALSDSVRHESGELTLNSTHSLALQGRTRNQQKQQPDGLVDLCGQITPESPIVTIGSNFTAICVLNDSCRNHYGNLHASQIIWKTRNLIVPKEQYSVINRTASQVTFNNTSTLASPLTCNILVEGYIEQNIYGVQVQLGFPPDKPKNVTCIVNQRGMSIYRLTCTWEPGRNTFLNTNYYLKRRWASQSFPDCIPIGINNTCTAGDNIEFFVSLKVWVEAKNDLGTEESEGMIFDPVTCVKLLPPHKVSVNVSELPTVLKLSWEDWFDSDLKLEHNIRYKVADSLDWLEVPPEDTATRRTSFILQDLKPHTKYAFQVRTKINDQIHLPRSENCPTRWSDWSKEAVGVTAEDKPSKGPPLWRKIISSPSPGNRTVLLTWQELDPSVANGIILRYEVNVTAKPPLPMSEIFSLNTNKLVLSVQNGTYEVRVTAYNSVGASPTSLLVIPAPNSKGLSAPVKDVKAFPKDGELRVEWTVANDYANKFIVEWCEQCDPSSCSFEWQQEPGTAKGSFLRGNIKPFKCYLITVYPLYGNCPGVGKSTEVYLQQGEPAKGPSVRTKKVRKNEAILEWEHLPVADRNGVIIYYAISYKLMNGNETVINVSPNTTEYTLSSLSSDTMYMIQMEAVTNNGRKRGPSVTFTTQKFGEGEIEAIVVPVCLAFLLITLLGVLFCFNKREVIKKHIWPNVPDPSKSVIAQWSPQTPSKHFNSKEQIYPEGSFTDVSVVEIEADDKKSFSEQDLKPFDVLKKEKNASEGHSSGIGGSSCMSSPRQSVSDSDEGEPAQNTSSTVQYSTVVLNGYRDQIPSVQTFSRSESTQPLLDSEERLEEHQVVDSGGGSTPMNRYFKQNCNQEEPFVDESRLEKVKSISPINEEDTAGLQAAQTCGSAPEREEQEAASAGAFHPSPDGQAQQFETLGMNAGTEDEMPKCYLPQTVRQGGYMPQ
ncbi:interleukin-6 receptor subunit beta isoform X1 [Sphaerodactylus townsendi]|uniref:interleukin-6 receptor subunit beta isoform X1 n=1 Tax=Sphaerodactylus townsendi TaxID=933632 RepID=UPI002025D95B|nr:interleukin-6 receptor subunit beta isoform X1 [Sphaerodactylus townsendi]